MRGTATLTCRETLGKHWPEYLIEAWALGMFMVSAGLFTVLLESSRSPVRALLADADVRRAIVGLAMGFTAIALIYSPWGQRSGAHMNPAVTLSFLLLGKMQAWDALFYSVAQVVGGIAGVLLAWLIAGAAFSAPEVNFVATLPGNAGVGAAFIAEFGISALLMMTVLTVLARPRIARYTGLFAGVLIACFVTFEAPLSGMSMNPARSLASATPSDLWQHFWIYVLAPVLGMALTALAHQRLSTHAAAGCAKLVHLSGVPCIHCGYEPDDACQSATER
ncbi:MAG TPA: aquaporin [Candidatus Binataceae bacterium]|nr:aquaporin [Candidatus Binataceae bacterium]